MSNENELNSDLNTIMTDFIKLKESYLKEKMLRRKFQGMTRNLQEENKVVRDLEKAERNKVNLCREFAVQQQDTISNFIGVKSENIKLSEHIKQLEATLADLERQLADEKKKCQSDREKLKLGQSQEMEELKLNSETKVMEAKREVQDIKAKFHAQYSELAKKLENLQNDKSNEINIIVFEYEERLHQMEERLNATEIENKQIRDRAAADVVLSQKKVLALEQQYNDMIQEREKQPLPLPAKSLETTRQNKSFQYHMPSNVNQHQHLRTPLQSIIRKISAYDSVQSSSNMENILSAPSDFRNPAEVGAGDSTPALQCTAKIGAGTSSNSSMTMSVPANRFTSTTSSNALNSSVATRSSSKQFVTDPPALDTDNNINLKQVSNPSQRGRRTRFAAAKKRKLFSCNAQDNL